MLNELYRLSEALQKVGITPRDWHKNFKQIPKASEKKPCYKISLGEHAEITDISPLPQDVADIVRKWEPSNGNSFPAFNIKPLYRITDPERRKLLEKWRKNKSSIDCDQLQTWCSEEASQNWDDKIVSKLECCLCKIPQALADKLGNIPESYIAFKKLLTQCAAYSPDSIFSVKLFRTELERCLWKKLKTSEHVPQLLPFLVCETTPEKLPSKDQISVCLDVAQWTDYPVIHHKTMSWLNDCLIGQPGAADTGTSLDAFALDSIGYDEKLPEVKLPVLGGVKLRAMSSEIPCQDRYGTIDAQSFLVGKESRRRMKGALEWLGAPEREELTWGRANSKELIFAYPTDIPPRPIKLAGCFGTSQPDNRTARFEDYAKDVIVGLRGLMKPLKEIELQLFSLRKMDKARTKVVFHRNYTAQRLADAAEEWQAGCQNIPTIRWRVWGEEKGKWIEMQPEVPFPLQIAKCLNQVWKLDGSTDKTVSAVKSSDGIELLLDQQVYSRLVPHLLTILLQNSKGLFLSMGMMIHKNDILTLKNDLDRQKQWLPAIIGLLLYKLNIRKEDYMNNAPYLIGNLLKISDDLHAIYCKEVRSNQLPPQLLGNALMAAALDSPEQALAQLALRIAPYLGWAKTNNTDSAGLSHYILKNFSEIEKKLQGQVLPKRLNDADRAQLLLGYLAK
jgi:hypothetical protein